MSTSVSVFGDIVNTPLNNLLETQYVLYCKKYNTRFIIYQIISSGKQKITNYAL